LGRAGSADQVVGAGTVDFANGGSVNNRHEFDIAFAGLRDFFGSASKARTGDNRASGSDARTGPQDGQQDHEDRQAPVQ
ncbi:MAG: hypothetical protein VB143_09640, partial [Burkholderia sp.]